MYINISVKYVYVMYIIYNVLSIQTIDILKNNNKKLPNL